MKDYKLENLVEDTKQFLSSEYGIYLMQILEDTAQGHMSKAKNVQEQSPIRSLDRATAVMEVIQTIKSPLG
jgi:hypothetical protein